MTPRSFTDSDGVIVQPSRVMLMPGVSIFVADLKNMNCVFDVLMMRSFSPQIAFV